MKAKVINEDSIYYDEIYEILITETDSVQLDCRNGWKLWFSEEEVELINE